MAALLRLVIIGFIVLTIIYVSLSWWSRSVRRDKLEQDWAAWDGEGDKEAYMKEGMAQYERSLRRRLILLVYVVPVLVVGAIIYSTNFM